MSIEVTTPHTTAHMASERHGSKGEKKLKPSHGEKKRKREHKEDGHKSNSRSKKPRTNGTEPAVAIETNTPPPPEQLPFHLQTSSLYLPLAPISQRHPLEGLCAEHLSPLILQYYPPFSGVIISYSHPRLAPKPFEDDGSAGTLMQNIDEFAVSWTWVTAEFLLFKMEKGTELEAYVNLQNEGHLGVVCWNLFNASIERKRLPSDWKWIEEDEVEVAEGEEEVYAEQGHFVNGQGEKIEGQVKFRIKDVEVSADKERGFVSIEGTMLSEEEEIELAESERNTGRVTPDPNARKVWPNKIMSATSLGIPVEKDDDATGKKKRRH
ncbi:hypothetical protein BJ875DRAFT_52985 [Amylocarpus encephaloides]|uniref:DNA-directed RNA polymerase subunit n=1 Tax=Amylocarpus encephaloides TaxID=45428 RepID=A0A9P7YHL4_9HELO|nr:hypothetical protein BJ875DRAFT_52985 [Amylocarpus encephaloides]